MENDIKGNLGSDGIWLVNPIKERHFTYRSFFEKFVTKVHSVMLKCMGKHPYNSITSMVKYYESYKQQDLPLLEYYEKRHRPSITMDSQNCVGKALYLRRKLLKHLSDKYTDLEENLYLVTCNDYKGEDIPDKYQEEPSMNTGYCKDHASLILKFTLESTRRRGFLIFDHGYLLDFPVVVMEDALPPHTGKFLTTGRDFERSYEFIYHSENYILWIMKMNEADAAKAKDERSLRYRFFFVGKKLGNLCQIEKRNQMYGFHALAFAGINGPIAATFTVLGLKDHFEASVPVVTQKAEDSRGNVETSGEKTIVKIPLSYLLSDEFPPSSESTEANGNAEWNFVLNELNRRYLRTYPGDGFLVLLKRFAKLATDSDFVSELTSIDKEWTNTIENSFLN